MTEYRKPNVSQAEINEAFGPAYREQWNDKLQQRINADIEKNRKAEGEFSLPASAAGREIQVEQLSHDFIFGAHIFNFDQLGTDERNRRYKELYGTLFNSATIAFYWKQLELEEGHPRFRPEYRDSADFWNHCPNPNSQPHWRRPATDPVVEFCRSKGIRLHGHTLVWGNNRWQIPDWLIGRMPLHFLKKANLEQNPSDGTLECQATAYPFEEMSADEMAEAMPEYTTLLNVLTAKRIMEIAIRYGDKIDSWDVVNEAIMEDGSYRRSPFYEILGEEFIPLAFQYAHEADPDAELYYNDYNMWAEGKRNTVVKLIGELRKRGLRINAVGMQSHMGMDHPDLREYEKSIEAFAAAGVKVMVTEFDMSALPTAYAGADIAGGGMESNRKLNPYPDSLPAEVYDAWHARMEKVLEILLRHSDDITRVTFWGVCDGDSWLNGFPVRGRTDYALPFDRKHNAKPIVKRFIEMCGEIPADGGADNTGVEDNRK